MFATLSRVVTPVGLDETFEVDEVDKDLEDRYNQ